MDSTAQPAAGWYPDPAGSTHLRWWDGLDWTTHLLDPANPPKPAVTPAATSTVEQPFYRPMQRAPIYETAPEPSFSAGSTTTLAVWVIAVFPFLYYAADWAIIAMTNSLDPFPFGVVSLVVFVVIWSMALWDHAVLRSRGVPTASVLWMLLSPIGYLIARRVRLKAVGIRADAPGNVFVISLVAGVALSFVVAGPIVGRMLDVQSITNLQTQSAASLAQQTATAWTVVCPVDAPVETVSAVFTCHATDSSGRGTDLQATVLSARRFSVRVVPSSETGAETTT